MTKTMKAANAIEDAEKLDHSETAGGNIQWYSHTGKQCNDILRFNCLVSFHPVTALLHCYFREMKTYIPEK